MSMQIVRSFGDGRGGERERENRMDRGEYRSGIVFLRDALFCAQTKKIYAVHDIL